METDKISRKLHTKKKKTEEFNHEKLDRFFFVVLPYRFGMRGAKK
jgi:hypothetical protein